MALSALMAIAVLLPIGVRPTEAAFIAHSANPGAVFTAAADFNTVSVSLANPGSPLRGSVSLAATAASDRGMSSVVFQTSAAGAGSWTNACTANVAPFTCTWNTTAVGDGLRDVRAVATDTAGYSSTDTVTNRRVDNTAPTASTNDPGPALTGSVTVSGSASDSGSGLDTVTLQYRSATGSWNNLCTQATSPISCAWNTAPLADGLYDLRTVAADVAGNSQISTPVSNRRVDNTAPTATMTAPAAILAGTVTLQSTSADGAGGSGVASVRYEYKPSAGTNWSTACTGGSSPFSCSFNTGTATDGLYDFRAVATDGVLKTGTSTPVTSRRIDNTAPTGVTLGVVTSPLAGTVAFTGTAVDGTGSGIASLRFQYAPAGTGTWTDMCTDTGTPFTCSFSVNGLPDGLYDFRTLATDNAGNTTASALREDRRVDTDGPTVAITSPAAGLVRDTITLNGTATDPVGVTEVTFQYRQGAGAWQDICTDYAAPYTCGAIDTNIVDDGNYELRMEAIDTLNHTTISTPVVFVIDNTSPTAANVQAVNGGGTLGRIDANDTLTFTWSEPMAPASILAGWNGVSQSIRVRVNQVGGANNDTLDLYNAAGTTRLNVMSAAALRLNGDYAGSNPAWLNATMETSGNTIVVRIGTTISGSLVTETGNATMQWTASTASTDVVGNAATANTATESGNDRDF